MYTKHVISTFYAVNPLKNHLTDIYDSNTTQLSTLGNIRLQTVTAM